MLESKKFGFEEIIFSFKKIKLSKNSLKKSPKRSLHASLEVALKFKLKHENKTLWYLSLATKYLSFATLKNRRR